MKLGRIKKNEEVNRQKKVREKDPLLHTYLTSLLSLVLCVMMFCGTSLAWFSSEVESANNEIYVGQLEADLRHWDKAENGETEGWMSLSDTENVAHKVFEDDIKWYPDLTVVESLKVVNSGELPLTYKLSLSLNRDQCLDVDGTTPLKDGEIKTLTDCFKVYIKAVANSFNETPSVTIEDITAEDSGWKALGSLTEVLTSKLADGELPIGETDTADTTDIYSIALYMEKTAGDDDMSIMGQKLGFAVKLVAHQQNYKVEMQDVEVTPEVLDKQGGNSDFFKQDNTRYMLKGTFSNALEICSKNGLNQVFDGSGATFEKGILIRTADAGHGYADLQQSQSGTLTITGFKADTYLNVIAHSLEKLEITNNVVKAMDIVGGNFVLDISGNKIDGDFAEYVAADPSGNENQYGLSLRITDYELSITNNEITDTFSHSIGINGRNGDGNSSVAGGLNDYRDSGLNNEIMKFTDNKITVNSTTKTGRAAFKIWNDNTFAPSSLKNASELTSNAKALIDKILNSEGNNIFEIVEKNGSAEETGHVKFNIYDYSTNDGSPKTTEE